MPSYFDLTELEFAVVPNTWGLAPIVLDANGDGHFDLVVPYVQTSGTPTPFRIFAGDGAGGFTESGSLVFPGGAPQAIGPGTGVLLADFNGDGRSDVFVNDWGYDAPPFPGSHNVLLLSSGLTGMIDASSSVAENAVDLTYYVSSADIDGDGDLDIFVGNAFNMHAPYFLVNDGRGSFTRSTAGLPVDAVGGLFAPDGILDERDFIGSQSAFFDANGDSIADLLIMSGSSSQPSFLLLGDGQGTFTQTSLSLPAPAAMDNLFYAEAVLPGDINRDGRIDLIVSYQLDFYASGVLQVLINKGNGQFHDEAALRLPGNGFADTLAFVLKWTDMNGDGIQDIFAETNSPSPSQHAVVYLGDGAGHFVRFPLDVFAGTGIQITDLNGDGRADFVMPFSTGALADLETQGIRVLLARDAGLVHTGDGNANGLMGDSDAETFNGLGGDDVVFGGGGADTIAGGNGRDYLNGGADRDVLAGGDGADVLFGSSGADVLAGDNGNDTLDGGAGSDRLTGGEGYDRLTGGTGDDTYVVTIGDTLVEARGATGGSDTVLSAGNRVLGANLEILRLTGSAVRGTGNAAANTITGNGAGNALAGQAGNDTLAGGSGNDTLAGGRGQDALAGGPGADHFLFDTALGSGNIDTIRDALELGIDQILLDNDVFTAFTEAGALSSELFAMHIQYETSSGALYYDADGADGLPSIKFAIIGTTTHPTITASDFVIVG